MGQPKADSVIVVVWFVHNMFQQSSTKINNGLSFLVYFLLFRVGLIYK